MAELGIGPREPGARELAGIVLVKTLVHEARAIVRAL
jgi:hypothetical protein